MHNCRKVADIQRVLLGPCRCTHFLPVLALTPHKPKGEVSHKSQSQEHVFFLLYYKNKNSHQNTAKKITHFSKMTLPKTVTSVIGLHPSILPGEACRYTGNGQFGFVFCPLSEMLF